MKKILYVMTVLMVAMAVPASAKLVGNTVSYQVDGQEFSGYLAYDDAVKGKRPGILVVHEWWGHNPYARSRADKLAKMGYIAFALDMYGKGKLAGHPKDAKGFMTALMGDIKAMEKRFSAARSILESHPRTMKGNIGAIGYCMGGGIVLHMARTGADLKAVASFHGSLGSKVAAKPGSITAPLLVMNGMDDPFVNKKALEGFRKEMATAKANLVLKNYAGAKHSFTNPGADAFGKKFKLPLAYNADADAESWKEMQSFLAKHMLIKQESK